VHACLVPEELLDTFTDFIKLFYFYCCMQIGIGSPLLGVTASEGEIAATPGHQRQQLQQQTATQLNGTTTVNNGNNTTTTLANTKIGRAHV
jgi:hypothetical protein